MRSRTQFSVTVNRGELFNSDDTGTSPVDIPESNNYDYLETDLIGWMLLPVTLPSS